jgi:hypothetical protein
MLVVPDNSDDIVRELLRTCENEPREGLALIDSFDDELRYVRQFMFFRFIALRKLALRGIFANSLNTDDIVRLDIEQLRALVTAEELELSVEALREVREIERRHPNWIQGVRDSNNREDPFASRMVDDVCMVLERLRPAQVGTVLGWTKLKYFGTDRVGILNEINENAPRAAPAALMSAALEVRIPFDQPFRSAMAVTWRHLPTRGRYLQYMLLESPFRGTENLAQAGLVRSVWIFESGELETDQPTESQVAPRQTDRTRSDNHHVETAPKVGGGAVPFVSAVLVLGLLAGGAHWAQQQGFIRFGQNEQAREFVVEPYAPPETLVARNTGSNFRAMPFAEDDVSVLRESVAGEALNVTGRVGQPDGVWYRVRLDDGRIAYLKGTLVETQNDGFNEP